jgi:hypothetical protein
MIHASSALGVGDRDDDFDMLADGAVVGRIFKANAAQYSGRYIVCSLILREKYVCKATRIAPRLPPKGPSESSPKRVTLTPHTRRGFIFPAAPLSRAVKGRDGRVRKKLAAGMV